MITQIYQHPTNRWRELLCILFNHNWDTYGNEKNDEGQIMEEYNMCSRCFHVKRLVWIEKPSEVGRLWKSRAI